MKTTLCLLVLILTMSVSAADSSKILLRGDTAVAEEWKVSGAARAIVGHINVSADTIVYDRELNELRCEGQITIRVLDHVVSSQGCILKLSKGEKKVFIVSNGEIHTGQNTKVSFPGSAPESVDGRSHPVKLNFEYSMRPELRPAANRAPEPAAAR